MSELIGAQRNSDHNIRYMGLEVLATVTEHSWSSAILPHFNG
jgi:hypothetical protein